MLKNHNISLSTKMVGKDYMQLTEMEMCVWQAPTSAVDNSYES